jgi:apolipoprotein N-acyltransferase
VFADGVTRLHGWRRNLVAFGAGAASVLAMAPVFWSPVLFATLTILVWLIASRSAAAGHRNLQGAFSDGWWFGFGYFLAGLFWIGEAFLVEAEIFGWLLPFAVTLLPAGLAAFYAAAAMLAAWLWRSGLAGLLTTAVVFAAAEWLRGHVLTGFPWNVLGYALTYPDGLMQAAGIVGTYGLTLWTFVIFATPAALITPHGQHAMSRLNAAATLAFAATGLIAAVVWGYLTLAHAPADQTTDVRVRIVQPSVPQREKWLPEKQAEIFALHIQLSRQNARGLADGLSDIPLLVWPEAAMPFRPLEQPDALAAIAELLPQGSVLLSGGLRMEMQDVAAGQPALRRAYNSLMAFGAEGEPLAIYDKIHLVPFGEYLPFQSTLESIGLRQLTKLRGGFTAGARPRPILKLGRLPPLMGLVCYEAIFPGQIIQGGQRPQVLVNITNDGWFGNTTGPHQHLHQARVRAVEEGLPLIRAANNGISALIDAQGRVRAALGLNAIGVIDARLPPPAPAPPYSRFGDWLMALNSLAFLVLAWIAVRLRSDS